MFGPEEALVNQLKMDGFLKLLAAVTYGQCAFCVDVPQSSCIIWELKQMYLILL